MVRHHELGVTANAMTVFNVPDESFIERGPGSGQTTRHRLCYARQRDEGAGPTTCIAWCMAAPEAETCAHIEHARQAAGLLPDDHAVLFSTERYKQTGGRYFRPSTPPTWPWPHDAIEPDDIDRRLINHLHGGFPLCSEPYAQVGATWV